MENAPSRILIIDTAWLGDVVFTTSLIGAVRKAWASAEIHALVAPRGESILASHPHVDRLWVYDKHGTQKSLSSFMKLSRRLRAERFDLILNAHPSARSRLLTKLAQPQFSIGYQGPGSRYCFSRTVANDLAVWQDHVERRMNLLRVLRPDAAAEPVLAGRDPETASWAEGFLSRNDASTGPLLALICGSAWKTKQWDPEKFAALARRWRKELSGPVLVLGGTAERVQIGRIQQLAAGTVSLVDQPLARVAAVLARCQAAVGNDTGVTFLAVAAGCSKVIALYGCTQVNFTFPAPHRAIHAGVPCCLPRTGHGAHRCRWGSTAWCMNQIDVERVWEELLNADPGENSPRLLLRQVPATGR